MRLDEDRVIEALAALRGETAGAEAPPGVEESVLAAFRARQVRPVRVAGWWIAAAAALMLAGFVTVARRHNEEPHRVATVQQPARPQPRVVLQPAAPPQGPVRKVRRVAAKRRAPPLETWSDFVAVPFAPPLNGTDGGQVLQVRLPRATLQSFGFSMPVDRVFDRMNAEVMVGQDGVVHAIRFAK